MARVKTFVNGGSLLPGDLNSMEDDYELGFSTYKGSHVDVSYRYDAAATGGWILMGNGGDVGSGVSQTAATAGNGVVYLDPAIYAAGTRTTYYNIRCSAYANATASTGVFAVGLYPVTAVAGAAATVSVTLGTVVAGSTTTFTAPAASSLSNGASGDFAAPAAGHFALVCNITTAMVANSSVVIRARLFGRQV